MIAVLMGRTGAGKSTIEKIFENKGFKRIISYTTREPQVRNGVLEKDGIDYNFIDIDTFSQLYKDNKIVEKSLYSGNLYGSPVINTDDNYVAVLDYDGYLQYKKYYKNNVIGIYIKCSDETALKRIRQRDKNDNKIKERDAHDYYMIKNIENDNNFTINSENTLELIEAEVDNIINSI